MQLKHDFNTVALISSLILLASFPPHSSAYSSSPPKKTYKGEIQEVCPNKICKPFRWVAILTGGAAWANVGQTQSFTDDDSLYSYNADTSSQVQPMWGAFIGEELRFAPDWAMQVGIGYYQISSYEAQGVVTQGVDPATYEQYDYDYKVIGRQYLFEVKFLGDMAFGVHPYAVVGVGASFNSVYDYDVTVDQPFPFSTFTPEYVSNMNTNFSYTAGVGIDVDITYFARLGIGYRYAWLGHANLGDGEINTVPISNTLKQDHLDAQEAVLQLTFII